MELTPERRPRQQSPNVNHIIRRSPRIAHNSRIKKPPPITPRRFTKFFAPRLQAAKQAARSSRKALRDLSNAALNSRHGTKEDHRRGVSNDETPAPKRRKLSFTSVISSPTLPSSPLRHLGLPSSQENENMEERDFVLSGLHTDTEATTEEEDNADADSAGSRYRIAPFRSQGLSTSLLNTRISGRHFQRIRSQNETWLHETSAFCSSDKDINNGPNADPMPFSTAACNTNPVVAIGDEDGIIRLVDSANTAQQDFSKTFLTFKTHDNAIMDLCFSEDDSLLVSGSGDQTCHVIDVQRQTSLCHLEGHLSSVKKVAFQPGSRSVLATCARDGNINIWDLRCNTRVIPGPRRGTIVVGNDGTANRLGPVNTIQRAHGVGSKLKRTANAAEGRIEFTVTSLSFLDSTRPNLFVSTSEADSVVRLWDLRTQYNKRKGTPTQPVPVSCTQEPESHSHRRSYGITSVVTSTDSSRIYTLCRDKSIYVYSTSHLILGSAPELSSPSTKPFRPGDSTQKGLGPLYAFRHSSLTVSTFYSKLAIRKATDTHTELLATGSSEDCAVLFPTSERYIPNSIRGPALAGNSTRNRVDNTLLVYEHGTPLIRGHRKEVTAVAWTSEGNLITTADDFSTRCWREDTGLAKRLRGHGQVDGQRWRCGYADVQGEYDEDE